MCTYIDRTATQQEDGLASLPESKKANEGTMKKKPSEKFLSRKLEPRCPNRRSRFPVTLIVMYG
jgi:hypothetical protein